MGENSKIEWTDHTFNPWWGCIRVSPGCENCYAETFAAQRMGLPIWGPAKTTARRVWPHDGAHWQEPRRWNRQAAAEGRRFRVFCASMADVFEDHPQLPPERETLWRLIEETPFLDWQLLTKRPENVLRMVPESWRGGLPENVWIGTSVEDQRRAEERIPELLRIPAAVRFLSCEPLLGPVRLDADWLRCPGGAEYGHGLSRTAVHAGGCCQRRPRIHWVIVGGESGPKARPCDVQWILRIVKQCKRAAVPVFVKQLGAFVVDRDDVGFEADLSVWADGPDAGQPTDPRAWPRPVDVEFDIHGFREAYQGAPVRVHLRDRKGGDPSEWPLVLRVREFPVVKVQP